ncbi:MAG: crossover junction endodeoxyribonuclease RuvC [Clostridiales bacterium]|nr:crossover junction endodeoxyribonuclease RuvC [Clostridiales bacterium]
MIILGIDPGIAIVGYGVIEYKNSRFVTLAHGSIQTPAHTNVEDRLMQIYDELDTIIKMYHPSEMAIEELFFNTNQKTMVPVAEARGVILLCARQNGLSIAEYTPLQVKQSVVGYGRAVKKQVMHMVSLILRLENTPKLDDTCDALAIAVCHANCNGSRVQNYYNLRK